MNVTREILLRRLPPYVGTSVVIEPDQDVGDIIKEILSAHRSFTGYYDQLAPYFDAATLPEICDNIQGFLSDQIEYREESRHDQTTALPTSILFNGFGDCKHTASFAGGILSAITRTTGRKINWCYRFVSYKILESTPYHVFVVVFDRGREIWIDPTPGADKVTPVWIVDKYVKNDSTMLRRVIAGIDSEATIYGIGVIDPEVVIQVAQTVFSFIKSFADKVPNYPIKTTDTLNKIVAEINQLLPMPPKSLADAQRLLIDAKALQAPLVGDTDSVRRTYYMIYGDIITALTAYIAKAQASGIDPNTGLPVGTGTDTAKKNMLLLGGAGLAAFMLIGSAKGKRSVHGIGKSLLPIALGGAVIYFLMNKGSGSKRDYLKTYAAGDDRAIAIFGQMTDAEINAAYSYIHDYVSKGTFPPDGSVLSGQIDAIAAKYDIFS